MSDVGTITVIEPEDGLGWIEMPNGDRVRFGGTACKGFVPAIGMQVEVIDTKPGYGGVLKATELRKAQGNAAAGGPAAAAAAMGAPMPAAAAAAAAPVPRTYLHTIQQSGARTEDLLQMVLGRADVDDGFHADLERAHFEVAPQPGPALGCRNPWFYVVAMNGGGDAYGVYVHPLFDGHPAPPWLFWDHEQDILRFVAQDTASFLRDMVATAAESGVDADTIARLRTGLSKLGVADEPGRPLGDGEKVDWLPPDASELRPLDAYLAETDGAEMERGLLAHAFARGDAHALTALKSIYDAWEWKLPGWV
ncbi:MAG: hypothetical protein H6719_21760 [Sandaracinaceae bacterium]|nr:hypothetical protein [Sandaracinaceae bacterium]